MRIKLTDETVAALMPRRKAYVVPDLELNGHYVRVQPGGSKCS